LSSKILARFLDLPIPAGHRPAKLQKGILFAENAQRQALRLFSKSRFSSSEFQSEISNLKFSVAPFESRKRTRGE
jgi:hypothetical protein